MGLWCDTRHPLGLFWLLVLLVVRLVSSVGELGNPFVGADGRYAIWRVEQSNDSFRKAVGVLGILLP